MPVPKKRTSRSVRNMRRSHDGLTKPNTMPCSRCGAATLRHRVCMSCGSYKGREVLQIASNES